MPGQGHHTGLGLERDARVRAAAIAPLLSDTPIQALRDELEAALSAHWGVPVAVLPDTCLAPLARLKPLLEPGDAVWVSRAIASRHRQAVESLAQAGCAIEAVLLEGLAERLAGREPAAGRVWLVADGLDGRNGQEAPLEALWTLLERHPELHLVLDETWRMGWCGAGGRGLALAERPAADRLIVLADLGPAFGAEVAVLASPREAWVQTTRTGMPADAFDPARLGGAIALAALHRPRELKPLQARLAKRLQVCDRLLKVHRLPHLAAAHMPFRFVAMGAPTVAYAMADRLMAEGLLVSVATVPGAEGPQAALRFAVTIGQPLDELQAMVEAIARHLPGALTAAGLSHEALCAAHGMASEPKHGQTIDMAMWRSGRAKRV